ncbi:MAG: AbrB/MazE/SpoVT family DNA-binding domain-containing protein [Deltaproteobacteria bacterium]|nr:AbrB/MazE/SpoVT family DNA-binding domain-containing protein [Deltaproteobacteria bacterium]
MVAATKPEGAPASTTLSSKGQVVIPKAVRERLGLQAGDVLDVDEVDGAILLRVRRETAAEQKLRLFGPPVPLDAIAGRLRHLVKPGPPPTTKEMREQARADFARRWREKEARIAALFARGDDGDDDGDDDDETEGDGGDE